MNETFTPVVFVLDLDNHRDYVGVETMRFHSKPPPVRYDSDPHQLVSSFLQRVYASSRNSEPSMRVAFDEAVRILHGEIEHHRDSIFVTGVLIVNNRRGEWARELQLLLQKAYGSKFSTVLDGSRMMDKESDENYRVGTVLRLLRTDSFRIQCVPNGY